MWWQEVIVQQVVLGLPYGEHTQADSSLCGVRVDKEGQAWYNVQAVR